MPSQCALVLRRRRRRRRRSAYYKLNGFRLVLENANGTNANVCEGCVSRHIGREEDTAKNHKQTHKTSYCTSQSQKTVRC